MKKKIVSMILALSLVISGLPVTAANAAELGENEFQQDESTNVDNTTEAAETESSTADETENVGTESGAIGNFEAVGVYNNATAFKAVSDASLSADYSRLHVDSNGKAVGSDGVTYDDVAYLSASTVMALDAEVQDDYIMLCDVAAKWAKDGIEDIVIAVDENGMLNWSCYVPGVLLAETQKELIEGALASETEAKESTETEESSEDKTPESEGNAEAVSTEDAGAEKTEAATDETTAGEESETQSVQEETETEKSEIEETATDGTETESSSTEESTVEETTTEGTTDESESTEENSTEAAATEEESTVEETTIEETAIEETSEEESTVEDVFVELSAENMDLIPAFVNEQVELADEVDVDVIDLGYGMNNTFNATLPSDSYFSRQLTSTELKVYNSARKSLTKGNTTFEMPSGVFDYSQEGMNNMMDAAMRSLSVIILSDTEKVEWFANPGGFGIKSDSEGNLGTYNPATNKITKCTIEVKKSPYYSKALDDSANAQVSKLVTAAQEYAVKNYPTLPAYGVVEFFDKWICENNYYNTPGGVEGVLGAEVYYNCHSSYGALLRGYAVCESYAKAMSRLMDAVGIPNMYVTGYAFGDPTAGHAWNYVQMPDGNWYLLDSTWNNPSESAADAYLTSTKDFLLSAGDRYHTPTGSEYNGQSKGFTFPELSSAKYVPETGSIELNKTTMDLVVKQKFKLSCDNAEINNTYSTWSSSNASVAKVDAKGNVTAVAPGTAVITLSTLATAGVELKAECVVNVYQVKDINSARTGKATDNLALGTNGSSADIYLNVNVGAASPYTAQELVNKKLPISNAKNAAAFEDVKCTSSKTDIAQVTAQLTGNTIKATITPKNAGSSVVTINFGGKKTTIKVTVGELINANMFEIDWSKAGVDEKTMSINYTGKAIAPKVTKKSDADKAVKFKTTYLNNKNAGTASVIISGTGKYGGEIRYDFEIKKLLINSSSIEFKLNKASNVYNAGSNPAKTTVKYLNGSKKVGLKLGTDYQIVYKIGNTETNPVNAGEYTLAVRGIGSYEGEYTVSDKYTITQCEINKAKVTLASSNQMMVPKVCATVKLGKNVLSNSNYEIKYYSDKQHTQEVSAVALKAKTTYYAVITAKGNNMKNGTKEFAKTFKTK